MTGDSVKSIYQTTKNIASEISDWFKYLAPIAAVVALALVIFVPQAIEWIPVKEERVKISFKNVKAPREISLLTFGTELGVTGFPEETDFKNDDVTRTGLELFVTVEMFGLQFRKAVLSYSVENAKNYTIVQSKRVAAMSGIAGDDQSDIAIFVPKPPSGTRYIVRLVIVDQYKKLLPLDHETIVCTNPKSMKTTVEVPLITCET